MGTKKGLAWTKEFKFQQSTSLDHTLNVRDGWFLATEIFALNKFDVKDWFQADKERFLLDLLSQSEQIHGHSRQVAKHATNPMLDMYYYVKSEGKTHSLREGEQVSAEDKMSVDGNSAGAALPALGTAAAFASASSSSAAGDGSG
eukprot:8954870-Lingulodinium_polyedra.AAC.1